MTVIPTLHCRGRCEEAIALYKKAFDLQVDFIGKDEQTGLVFHTEARIGAQRIRISDGGKSDRNVQADSLFLAVVFETEAEVHKTYDILQEGGVAIQRPHATDFSPCMSELKDRFGFRWFLMTDS